MIALILPLLLAGAAMPGDRAVSVNDGKQVLVGGEQVVPARPAPDSLSIVDYGGGRLTLVASVPVPASVIGPPRSVAMTCDGRQAIVTSARRLTADRRGIEPDDVVSVVDLDRRAVVQTLHAGAGASGVAIDATGKRVLVANRAAGSVSLFALAAGRLSAVATLRLGEASSSPAQPVFVAPDLALVTRDGDHRISLVRVSETGLSLDPLTLAAGLRPYGIDAVPARRLAVVATIGGGGRDVDTISLIDLASPQPSVVGTVAVGLTPEGIKLSPDGRYVAVTVNDGSNAAPGSPHWHRRGELQIWRIAAGRLVRVARARMGAWGQGMVWSRDGRQIVVQAMVERRLESFSFDGRRLRAGPTVTLSAGPAAMATCER